MIDREKTIEGLKCHISKKCETSSHSICPYWEDDNCSRSVMNDVLELLKERDWNLITEDSDGFLRGLPGDDGQYLMTDGNDIWIDDYVDGVADGIILDSGKDIREIVAWMHTPELPKLNRR